MKKALLIIAVTLSTSALAQSWRDDGLSEREQQRRFNSWINETQRQQQEERRMRDIEQRQDDLERQQRQYERQRQHDSFQNSSPYGWPANKPNRYDWQR